MSSYSYNRYKNMAPEKIQELISQGHLTVQYLNWLGITGPGAQLKEIIKND